jgi:selenide,water dikinase
VTCDTIENEYTCGVGFGLLGHARNLANHQNNKNLVFRIHTLPIIDKMDVIEQHVKRFNLFQGFSAETSGKFSNNK